MLKLSEINQNSSKLSQALLKKKKNFILVEASTGRFREIKLWHSKKNKIINNFYFGSQTFKFLFYS